MLHPGRLKEYLLFQHCAFMRLRINEKHRRNLELIYRRTGSAGNRRDYGDDLDPLSPVFHICAVYRRSTWRKSITPPQSTAKDVSAAGSQQSVQNQDSAPFSPSPFGKQRREILNAENHGLLLYPHPFPVRDYVCKNAPQHVRQDSHYQKQLHP
ncbi:hypothetical protein PO909_033047 [Leuciscus waleckii]